MKHLLLALALALPLACHSQSAGDYLFSKKSSDGPLAGVWVTPGAPPALFGTITGGNATSFTLGSGLALSGSTLSATGGAWGSITGTLSSQTDLQTALDAKASTSALSSYLTTASAASTYQPLDADLTALAGLTSAADALPYFTGAGTAATTTLTATARTLLDDSSTALMRGTLGLGTLATQNANDVTISGGTITGINLDGSSFQSGQFALGDAVTQAFISLFDDSGHQMDVYVETLTNNRAVSFGDASGTILTTGSTAAITGSLIADGTITNAKIADGTIQNGKLAITPLAITGGSMTGLLQFSGTTHAGLRLNNLTTVQRNALVTVAAGMEIWNTTTGRVNIYDGTAWTDGFTRLAGDTMTGALAFSGTTHAGLRLNNLTTVQRDALGSPAAGMVIWNTSAARIQAYNGSAWTAGMVRLDGDTMTGALSITAGTATASTPPLNITQTWNGTGVTFQGPKVTITDTSSAITEQYFGIYAGASGTTKVFGVEKVAGSNTIEIPSARSTSNTWSLDFSELGLALGSARKVSWSSTVNYYDTKDITLERVTANVLGIKAASTATGSSVEMAEMSAPGTPSADRARLYLEDNGSGKTRFVIKWADGTTTVLATQP